MAMKPPLTHHDVTEALQRAQAEIGSGHNSFVYVPDESLVAEEASKLALGGLPIAVKDVIDCAGLPTAAGSTLSAVQPRSARLVDQLVSKGAAVVGKTQAHQFSFGTTGDVSCTGPVKNALDSTLMAGGSSGGSAVAVALGIVGAAVGTDTAGSLRIPAALNGVVGFKPTYDALSSDGIFPLSPSLDTPGFVAQDVRTISRIWEALHNIHAADVSWSADKTKPLRFGVLPEASLTGMASRVAQGFATALTWFNETPHELNQTPHIDLDALRRHYLFIVGWEGSNIHGGFARTAPELYDEEIRERIASISGVSFQEYFETLKAVHKERAELMQLFDDVDVLVSPTLAIETPKIGQRTVRDDSGLDQVWGALAHFTSPWNVVRFPAISLPIPGAEHPAPIGLQLIGRPGSDHQLLSIAHEVETVFVESSA